MNLGILVNSDQNPDEIIGFTTSALSKGHEVIIFVMDQGISLLEKQEFTNLSSLKGVNMSFCVHSAETQGVKTDGLPETVTRGSQFHNASMNQKADKVIVL